MSLKEDSWENLRHWTEAFRRLAPNKHRAAIGITFVLQIRVSKFAFPASTGSLAISTLCLGVLPKACRRAIILKTKPYQLNQKHKPFTHQITELEPISDHKEIVRILGSHCFPWDVKKALEFALYRTFAVPSISALLSKTGEFKNRTRKRYDDTELLMAEILENGYDSEGATRAFRRMNEMHNRFNISNEDYLYVLTTFVFGPIYWIEKYGWRKLVENEKVAIFLFYREVGKRMKIKNIPESYAEFEQFHLKYEDNHFRYAETNKEINDYTMSLLLGMRSESVPGYK